MESRTQASRQGQGRKKNPKPRTRTALPRTDPLEPKNRNARGQSQGHRRKCFQKKKNMFKKYFRRSPKEKFQAFSKKRSSKNFSGDLQNLNNSKSSAVLEPRTGQYSRTGGFEGMAKDFKMCPRGIHLWQAVHSPLNKKMKKMIAIYRKK